MRVRQVLAALACMILATAPSARGQRADPTRPPRIAPLIVQPSERSALSQYPVPPLAPDQLERLQRAVTARNAGHLEQARKLLLELRSELRHHAQVLTELAVLQIARQEYGWVVQIGRSARLARRDSLLLGHELTEALDRLGRPREAAQVVLEAWIHAPTEAGWARNSLLRLTPTDPNGVRGAVRKAVAFVPQRLDMVRVLAEIEWRLGDTKATLRALSAADHAGLGPPLRWGFADELLHRGTARDSMGAIEVLLDLAGDVTHDLPYRFTAARRASDVQRGRPDEPEGARSILARLDDIPPNQWPSDLLGTVVRGLRRAGQTAEARRLLETHGAKAALPPELALEQALADLKDGPAQRGVSALAPIATQSPEAAFRYAEALFFAGQPDSALVGYERIAAEPHGSYAGAALERIYLIEDARPPEAVVAFGRVAYETWRGEEKRATALAESLYRALDRGPLWAQAAVLWSSRLVTAGHPKAALEPLLAVADSLPEDRLAPLARQRAGDVYRIHLKDDARALNQYEECLSRYPRAWNAPEVRRTLESLRRERRF